MLAEYLLTAMLAWTRVPADCNATPDACAAWSRTFAEDVDDARARFATIANEVADEAARRGGRAWRRARVALELVAIGFEETQFARLVDDGSCNAPELLPAADKRRVEALGGCDSGRAFGPWQIHPDLVTDVQRGVTGGDLIADRTLAIRIAWDLHEVRPVAWTVWLRAARRAAAWMREHPFAG